MSKHLFFNIIMSDMSQSDKIVENAMSPLADYGYQKGKKVHNGLILRNTISHVNTSNMLGKHIVNLWLILFKVHLVTVQRSHF